MYNNNWSDYLDYDLYKIINADYSEISFDILANEEIILKLPFSYHKMYGTDFEKTACSNFDFHFRLGYPHLI